MQTTTKESHRSGLARGMVRSSGFAAWEPYETAISTTFEMISDTHPGPPYKVGGPWYMHKVYDDRNAVGVSSNLVSGTMMLGPRSQAYTPLTSYTPLTHNEEVLKGTSLWSAAVPTKITSDLPTALGELRRDGLPALPGHTWRETTLRALPHSASGEYLNYEFGWKPLVSDLKKFAYAVNNYDKIVEGYRKGANSELRRRRELPEQIQTKNYTGSFSVYPTKAGVFATGGGSTETVSQKVWFTGRFKYYLPVGDDLASRLVRYKSYSRKLLGVRLTPDVVWNLSPWSWAADWFADTGTVLSNIAELGTDGLYGHECYLMHETSRQTRCTGLVNAKSLYGQLYQTYGEVVKVRVKASPFGFGVTSWQDLSLRQTAIAAAIGLSYGSEGFYTSR